MASEPTYWNGEPTPARKVWLTVPDSDKFPLYWARTEGLIGHRIEAVEVSYFDEPMYLDDRTGSAWAKVTEGHGSPRWGHRSIAEITPADVGPRHD